MSNPTLEAAMDWVRNEAPQGTNPTDSAIRAIHSRAQFACRYPGKYKEAVQLVREAVRAMYSGSSAKVVGHE